MGKYCFGIDVGGTTVKCGLFETDGTLLDKWEIVTRTENGGENVLPDIAATIISKLTVKGIAKEDVVGVGVGIPGPVMQGVVPVAVNLHWGEKNVEYELGKILDMKVRAGNDANVAALGELWKGGGEGKENLIMVTSSNRSRPQQALYVLLKKSSRKTRTLSQPCAIRKSHPRLFSTHTRMAMPSLLRLSTGLRPISEPRLLHLPA